MRNFINIVIREDRGDSFIFNNISIIKIIFCYFKKMGLVEWERRGGKENFYGISIMVIFCFMIRV